MMLVKPGPAVLADRTPPFMDVARMLAGNVQNTFGTRNVCAVVTTLPLASIGMVVFSGIGVAVPPSLHVDDTLALTDTSWCALCANAVAMQANVMPAAAVSFTQ